MNNFTPEYIALCKNSKVQGLRPIMTKGDYFCGEKYKPVMVIMKQEYNNLKSYPWLPTGDQLDDEIVKRISPKEDYYFIRSMNTYYTEIKVSYRYKYNYSNDNPLIAKISLLIQLLEGE